MRDTTTHINKVINAQSPKQVLQNQLRFKTSIEATKWLTKQACAFQDHDESNTPSICSNFFELIKLLRLMNENITKIVLECVSGNTNYTSPMIHFGSINRLIKCLVQLVLFMKI